MTAPDLERYLDPRNVDLAVTDQVEAVRVRVARGLEVFERRRLDGLAAARRCLALGATLFAVCCVAGYLAGPPLVSDAGAGFRPWAVAGAAAGGALWAASLLLRAGLDRLRLRRLSGRFSPGDLGNLESSREVLDYGKAVLEEARALGAVPE